MVFVVAGHHGCCGLEVTAWLREQGFGGATSQSGGIEAWASGFDPEMARD